MQEQDRFDRRPHKTLNSPNPSPNASHQAPMQQFTPKMPSSAEDGQNLSSSTVLGREEAWKHLSQLFHISPHYKYKLLQVCLH